VRRTRTALATATTLSLCLALSACGGEEDAPEKAASTPSPTAEVSGDPDTWPMTGLPVAEGSESIQKHPVLVLKMDNTPASAPQEGLGSADLVVEELVEGGVTRLAAFYYSKIPGDVGPVRSMRASDIGIVAPVDGAMVTSGAAGVTISRIKKAGIEFFAEGAGGFYREESRSAPYNLFTNLEDVAEEAATKPARPVDYLPFGPAEDLPAGQEATSIAASFSAGHTTEWTFRKGTYVNENTFAADGDEFPADTVLVLKVKVGDAGYLDPAGNPVPETKLEGKGEALLFHDGRLVRGTWSKDALDAPLELATKAGPLTVPVGHTWVELVPDDGGDVTFE
jgi:hypothetical protein